MCLDVLLERLLVTFQWKLLIAHRTDFPVTFHVLLKVALVVVGWKHHSAQRTLPLHGVSKSENEYKKTVQICEKHQYNQKGLFNVTNAS